MGPRGPGLLGPATQPEGGGGVRVPGAVPRSGRRAEDLRRTTRDRGQLRRGRHRRVPLPPGRAVLRLPRGQHPAPGRAPHHRDHHRHRPGEAADPHRRRRATRGRAPGRGRPRRGGTPQRRGSRPRLRTLPRPDRVARTSFWAGDPGGHRSRRGRLDPGRLRLDDRQDHRVRSRPRRSAGPAAAGHAGDHGRDRGRLHQQELRARSPLRARGDRRQRRHRLDRSGPVRGRSGRPPALRGGAGGRRDRGVRDRGGRSSAPG